MHPGVGQSDIGLKTNKLDYDTPLRMTGDEQQACLEDTGRLGNLQDRLLLCKCLYFHVLAHESFVFEACYPRLVFLSP
jgi:hypothetical protein